jgi:hypothetical protein
MFKTIIDSKLVRKKSRHHSKNKISSSKKLVKRNSLTNSIQVINSKDITNPIKKSLLLKKYTSTDVVSSGMGSSGMTVLNSGGYNYSNGTNSNSIHKPGSSTHIINDNYSNAYYTKS